MNDSTLTNNSKSLPFVGASHCLVLFKGVAFRSMCFAMALVLQTNLQTKLPQTNQNIHLFFSEGYLFNPLLKNKFSKAKAAEGQDSRTIAMTSHKFRSRILINHRKVALSNVRTAKQICLRLFLHRPNSV